MKGTANSRRGRREAEITMRKLIVSEFMTLDGV